MAKLKIEQLLDRFAPAVKDAFLEAIEDIKSNAEIGRIARFLEQGDIEGALRAVHLDPAAFRVLERAVGNAFEGGGAAVVDAMPRLQAQGGGRAVIRFDSRNLRAEAWLRDHSSTMVTNIVEDQRRSIRTALEAGLRQGWNPRSTALDIVGRIEAGSNRRVGGIIGLTSNQAEYVQNASAELLSGDPARMRNYLARGRRDARFDSAVQRAIAEGRPLTAAEVQKITGRYADRLLDLRGETLARTETMGALGQAKKEAFQQAIESGSVDPHAVTKVWRAGPRTENARAQHQAMNGQEVAFQAKFVAPDGTELDFPGDPEAPIEHTANCRCDWDIRIDYLAGVT